MNLVRKIKISKFMNIDFSLQEKQLIDYLTDKLSGLVKIQLKEYDDYIFYLNQRKEFVIYFCISHSVFKNNACFCTSHINIDRCKVLYGVLYDTISKKDIGTLIEYFLNRTESISVIYKYHKICDIIFDTGDYDDIEQILKGRYNNGY